MKTAQTRRYHDEATSTKSQMYLLVVEDHVDLSLGTKALFNALGYRARFVEDVASAMRAACEEIFDVLLSEIGLPDGDGWDLLWQLDESGHRPPHALAMSGYGSGEDVARSKAAGCALHLVKPFDPKSLEKLLCGVEAQVAVSA